MSLTSSLRISRQLSLPRQHGLPSAAVPHRRPVSSRSPASPRNLSNANLIRDHEVGGSNPLATTILFEGLSRTPGLPPHHCRRNCGVQHEGFREKSCVRSPPPLPAFSFSSKDLRNPRGSKRQQYGVGSVGLRIRRITARMASRPWSLDFPNSCPTGSKGNAFDTLTVITSAPRRQVSERTQLEYARRAGRHATAVRLARA